MGYSTTDSFIDGWQPYARPVAYINDNQNLPQVLEEDTEDAGSRVRIHDSSMFCATFNTRDTAPDKNRKFFENLCTVFPGDR